MSEHAPAKINLCLYLGPLRPDGRHELVTVFQPLALGDTVRIGPTTEDGDEVVCPGVEGDNLASAAVAGFREAVGWDGAPVRVTIEKRIPVAAGMAGGSADAAATLRLLAAEAGVAVDDPRVRAVAARLGADVPAQLQPARYLATATGDVLEPVAPVASYGVVVLRPREQLSTGAVFARADALRLARSEADLAARLAEVRAALPDLPVELAVNDLTRAAVDLCPSIAGELARMEDAGAQHVLLSGSGPTVVGLFDDPRAAVQAARRLGGEATRTV